MINKPFETAIKNILSYQKICINFDIIYNELYRQPFFQKKKTVEQIEIIQVVVSPEISKPESFANKQITCH